MSLVKLKQWIDWTPINVLSLSMIPDGSMCMHQTKPPFHFGGYKSCWCSRGGLVYTLNRGRCHISCTVKVMDHSEVIKQSPWAKCCSGIIRTLEGLCELAIYSWLIDVWSFNTDLTVRDLRTLVTQREACCFFPLLYSDNTQFSANISSWPHFLPLSNTFWHWQ